MCINNKDKIGAIKVVNGLLKKREVCIHQEDILIGKLKAMRENPNRSILDMQALLDEYYPEKLHNGKNLNYLYPYSYGSAYVSDASYPKFMSVAEYQKSIHDYQEQLENDMLYSEKAKQELEPLKALSLTDYNDSIAKIKEEISKKIERHKALLKESFKPERYVYAYNYFKTVYKLSGNDSIKLITTDSIGWSDFYYDVNKDISVHLKTNYGYGSASYFYCNIMYKGISILPYTDVVNYYRVNWMDFIHYTSKYRPDRDNWEIVLDFIVKTANLAKTDPNKFVSEWIVNELKEMMDGLTVIMKSSNGDIERFFKMKKDAPIGKYTLVRSFNNYEKNQYNVYPHERALAFKAEKVTGSLFLLENLRKLTDISVYVEQCIEEIISMNQKIIPEIENGINSISRDIDQLKKRASKKELELGSLEKTMVFHNTEIKKILDFMNLRDKGAHIIHGLYEAEREYIKSNPSYPKTKALYEKVKGELDEINNDIILRQSFIDELTKYRKRITKYATVAA